MNAFTDNNTDVLNRYNQYQIMINVLQLAFQERDLKWAARAPNVVHCKVPSGASGKSLRRKKKKKKNHQILIDLYSKHSSNQIFNLKQTSLFLSPHYNLQCSCCTSPPLADPVIILQ